MQPTIAPLFATRQAEQSFLAWAKTPVDDFSTYMQGVWRSSPVWLQSEYSDFQRFWDNTLHNGLIELASQSGAGSTRCVMFQD